MEKTIENGYTEINVFVRRTRQMDEFEPLVAGGSIRKMVKEEDKQKEMNNGLEDILKEVYDFLGIEDV